MAPKISLNYRLQLFISMSRIAERKHRSSRIRITRYVPGHATQRLYATRTYMHVQYITTIQSNVRMIYPQITRFTNPLAGLASGGLRRPKLPCLAVLPNIFARNELTGSLVVEGLVPLPPA